MFCSYFQIFAVTVKESAIFFLLRLFSHNHLELVGFVRFHHQGLLFYFILSSLEYFLPEEMFKKNHFFSYGIPIFDVFI